MYIRFSREDDKPSIEYLFSLGFGDRTHYPDAFTDLDGKYLLAFTDENQLIAMTGLTWSDEYQGYEVNWTCTHPDYRRKGVMHELFKRICGLTDEPIYCSCWRVGNNEYPNLYALMKDFGFTEVIRNRVTWDSEYNCRCARKFCAYRKVKMVNGKRIKEPCRCYEDLYLREEQQSLR